MNETIVQEKKATEKSARFIYILYLLGVVLLIPEIIGVIMAYANKGEAPDWLKSHYQFQIRTFWMGSLFLVIGAVLTTVFVGYFIIVLWAMWLIFRCIKGMEALSQNKPHPNPTGWMF